MTPTIAEIRMFGGNFAPISYATCNGQLLSIAEYTALFAVIGTTYGGDGISTFALPDLQGRLPIHMGQGPGLAPRTEGERAGAENATLTQATMPAHAHGISSTILPACSGGFGTGTSPAGAVFAASATEENFAVPPAPPAASGSLSPMAITGNTAAAGGSQPFSIMQPYQAINFIIALEGIFPSRA